ncbi:hypothetical protein CEF00_13095 [Lactobacillus crispatus]|nr:hypothetical protein CEF00_13095 [Lactobacillus crispatus]
MTSLAAQQWADCRIGTRARGISSAQFGSRSESAEHQYPVQQTNAAETTITMESQHFSRYFFKKSILRAFSSEVDTGSRQENASKQESRAPFRFYRNGKGSRSNRWSCGRYKARAVPHGV